MAKRNYRRSNVTRINTKGRIRFWLITSVALFILAGLLIWPQPYNATSNWISEKTGWEAPQYWNIPFKLGLDLQGGTQLIYRADFSSIQGITDQSDAIQGVRDVIERRVNAIGVSEPLVQTTKVNDEYRVIVELAGVRDVNEAIGLIGETPLLEFKKQSNEPKREMTAEEQASMDEHNSEKRQEAQDILRQIQRDEITFADAVIEHSEDNPEIIQNGGKLGVINEESPLPEVYEAAQGTREGRLFSRLVDTEEAYMIVRVNEIIREETVTASHILICFEGAERCNTENQISKEEALEKIQGIKSQANTRNFTDLAKENSTEPGAENSGGSLGTFKRGVMVPAFEEVVFDMSVGRISEPVETQFGYHLIYKQDVGEELSYDLSRVYIEKETIRDYVNVEPFVNTGLNGSHLERAQVQFEGQANTPVVGLKFNSEGAKIFEEITRENLNQVVAIYLDGEIISAPQVQTVITTGDAVISGNFGIEEAKILARRLNAGALPVPIELISQQTVGPTLGHASVSSSMEAGIIGLILVALFMILMYRIPGLLAVIALCFYGVMLLALFKVIGVTLTLPGLAGIVLSLGMAVDANVLIFERLKEELRTGKPYQSAVDEAFKRAWSSIRDGNASTLITTLILGWFATSFIKGFALTLSIGVILSMLTAIVVTRVLMKIFAAKKLVKAAPALYLLKKKTDEN